MRERVEALAAFFERFAPQDLTVLGEWYAADAAFKDPFNDVRGLRRIERVYAHMFEALTEPRFQVTSKLSQGQEAWLTWNFTFVSRASTVLVRGASHLKFDAAGKITNHRDYWDPAEELYEKAPVLGALMRWLRRRLAAPQDACRH